jgi:DNA polymerase III delta prime subunit
MRTKIFKSYKKILDDKKKDELKQQIFLEKYVIDNKDIDRLLLYHGIGTGKTRTSIMIAEALMKQNSKYKINVILPARLKTNYIDELILLLGKKYKKEYKKFIDPTTNDNDKNKMRLFFNSIIEKKFTITSYEYIINIFKKSNDINTTLKKLTKNRILIIDEFHNLIANYIDEKNIKEMYDKNTLLTKHKFIRALIMRYISRYAHDSCKMFFLTATPVFDNYMQFVELVKLLNREPINEDIKSIKELLPYLKGKISYYEITDRKDFPEVKIKNELIPLSKEQEKALINIQVGKNSKSEDDNLESFMMKQRQVCISIYDYTRIDKILRNLDKYAPKLKKLFSLIDEYQGKHLIYSNFIQRCLYIIKAYLDSNGWVNYLDNPEKYKKYKTYILWDGTLKDKDKQDIKNILNSVKNIDGKIIRVILGSPSIKEGISFKHIQHFHQIDPVWNISAKEQIEGRCIRYKSHDDISKSNSKLQRKVIIHNYISVPIDPETGIINETCDEKIYNKIIPAKDKIIKDIKKILHKLSIDYYLYNSEISNMKSKSNSNSSLSINLSELFKKKIKKGNQKEKNKANIKNKCPFMRRPVNGVCSNGTILRLNAHGNECCYKK